MNYHFRSIWDIIFDSFEKVVDVIRFDDFTESDVIRLVHLAKKIEQKMGKENEIVVKRPFDT